MKALVPVLAALISGFAFYFSTGIGGGLSTTPGLYWLIALLAPLPVLWLAFRDGSRGWVVFIAAFAAMLTGNLNLLPAYLGTLPAIALIMGCVTPALAFALSVTGARFVAKRVAPISGIIAFAALATGFDYLLSLGPNGTAASTAYSQVEMPWMIQIASVFGLWGITAVAGLFAAALAMAAATHQRSFAILALAVLALNIGYSHWRMASAPKTATVRVGLAGDDQLIRYGLKDDEASALKVMKAYAEAGRKLANQNAELIVFPEKIAIVRPEWRGSIDAELETLAHTGHAMVVAGFDDRGTMRQNLAEIYFANGTAPQSYSKRRMVPGLESAYVPGSASYMTGERTGVAICKDMDFPDMLRGDAIIGPNLYAVPAWDFDRDAIWHARLAILRGVENGFSVARAANDGLLTVSDAYGRVLGLKKTAEGGMVMLRADIPRGPGATLYEVIGNSLAYLALALSALLLAVAFFARPGAEKP